MSINDVRNNALTNLGFSGNNNDKENAWWTSWATMGLTFDEISSALKGGSFSFPEFDIDGLTLTFGSFEIQDFSYAGGSITLVDDLEQYVVLSPHTQTLHTLDRLLDNTLIPLMKVTTASGVATLDSVYKVELPSCYFPKTAQKLALGQDVEIQAIGSSLIRGAGSTPRWAQMVFESAYVADGFNPPALAQMTFTNSALGGTDAVYSAALIGHTTFATDGDGSGDRTYCVDSFSAQRAVSGSASYLTNQKMSASSIYSADLVIVGLLPNGGYDQLNYFEGVVRRLRQSGVEVMIVTDNEYAAQSLIYDKGPTLAKWAKMYGCALVDTAAFVKEVVLRGGNPYFDGIHMNDSGHDAWATAVSGALSGYYGEMKSVTVDRTMLAPTSDFPAQIDVCFDFDTSTDTAPVSRTSGGNASAFTDVFGQPTDYFPLTTGQSMWGGHPLALGFFLIVDGGSAFEATVTTNDGATSFSISADGSQTRADVIMLRDVDESHNKAFDISVTSGELRVVAVCYTVPCYDDVTSQVMSSDDIQIYSLSGTSITKIRKTNSTNESISVSHPMCRKMAVVIYSGDAAGQMRTNFTGNTLVSADYYKASTTMEYLERSGNGLAPMGVASVMSGLNGSAVATSSSKHRVAWANAFAVLDRD